ncbi:hypothetical protein B0T10DRAFT_554410 [Thelonectria olida]|uniref:Uncharacterized protein n=1 Tax=Thelonectria olida TaxID=1576542 RepID=A0A9P8WIB3_9HYPO|nr:hypothetical protein B0T10DRAFT_554410 [Thelonectria olida]
MRTTGLLVVAAAAAAHAGYTEKDGKYMCEEPNASYCLGGDIILRCDAYGVGTPGRCSDNLSGYPPAGGVASCYEKAGTHSEAACEKNCVVYYPGAPYTLPAELCHPSQTSSAVNTFTTVYTHPVPETTVKPYHNTTSPGNPGESSKPGEPSKPTKPGHPGYPSNSTQPAQPGHPTATGYTTKCVTIVYPNPTNTAESKTRTITYTSAVYAPGTETSAPQYPPNTSIYLPTPSGSPPPPPHNSTGPGGYGGMGIYIEQTNQGEQGSSNGENAQQGENGESPSGSETKVPVSPTSTTEPEAVTGAAAMNTVSCLLALVAVVAAYLI